MVKDKYYIAKPVSCVYRAGLPPLFTNYEDVEVEIFRVYDTHVIVTSKEIATEDTTVEGGKIVKKGDVMILVHFVRKNQIFTK